jgi:hypothetical protein
MPKNVVTLGALPLLVLASFFAHHERAHVTGSRLMPANWRRLFSYLLAVAKSRTGLGRMLCLYAVIGK